MEYRKFGRSDFKVSVIGMGTYFGALSMIKSDDSTSARNRKDQITALRKGFELGINLVDTAESYGTEPIVAKAIVGHKRDELFIATKVSGTHLRHDDVLKAARRSLENLKCRYIDLYQIHWPNPRVPIAETMKAMEQLVEEEKVKYIGVSNFSLSELGEANQVLSKNKIVSDQVEYSLLERKIERGLLTYCEKEDIAVIAHGPLAQGTLATPLGRLGRTIKEISQKHQKTPSQIALNWLVGRNKAVFPIPRASREERVVEDVGAVGWSLELDDLLKLESTT
jgi:diketogulonate reductase-like aldo/keto reductase